MSLHTRSNLKFCSSRKPSLIRHIVWANHSFQNRKGYVLQACEGKPNLSSLPFSETGNNVSRASRKGCLSSTWSLSSLRSLFVVPKKAIDFNCSEFLLVEGGVFP